MNTLIDMILASPFIALVVPSARWVFGAGVVLALLVAEFFSPFGFGLLSFALAGGWFFSRKIITFFDISSLASIALAFFIGITIQSLLVVALFSFERGVLESSSLLRGGIFAIRQFLAGCFIFALIIGLRAAYAVGIYAMAEEKNPFA